MPHTLSVLTDEISPSLSAAIRFAAEEELATVDVRSVDGVNFLSLPPERQMAVARELKDAGLAVGCLATPLLKWPAPGRTAATMGDQFGFDAAGRSVAQLYDDAFRAAEVLGTRHLRVFSFLAYNGFEPGDLDPEYESLVHRAERHGATIHVENENVCNIASVADLIAVLGRIGHPRLRALLDIPNAWRAGTPPTAAELRTVMPLVDQMHFKDYSKARGRFVVLGEGDIPFAEQLPVCVGAAAGRSLAYVVETHVPDDQPGSTRRSLAVLRRLAAEAG